GSFGPLTVTGLPITFNFNPGNVETFTFTGSGSTTVTVTGTTLPCPSTGGAGTVTSTFFTDGRLNSHDPWETTAVYCMGDGSVRVYVIGSPNWTIDFSASPAEIAT